MKIILILALIFIAQGVDAIEVGLIQESGQTQSAYVYNSAFCSPPPDCEEDYFTESEVLDGGYFCDSSFLDKIKLEPDECAYGYCYYEYGDGWFECDSETCWIPCGMIIYSDQLLPRSEQAECPPLPEPMVVVPRLGSGTFKPPEPESLISTSQWGEVPANQILVVTRKGCSHCIVQELAGRLGAKVVGYIDFISLYQLETTGKNEEDLRDALSVANSDPEILLAFPHQEIFLDNSPLDDPIYSKDRSRSYQIVGVQQSWDAINSSGLPLSLAKIGVIDDGLYKGYGEFDGVVRINTKSNGSLLKKPSSDYPIAGSHGTGIMNILAADPDNGGLVGIASEPLRDSLSVTMINMQSPIYTKSGDAWYMGYMLALSQAGIGSDILSFSWGNSEADPEAATLSEEFFKEWADAYPDHLFVCSAGNDGKALDGSRRFPYAYNLPNVIIVGCINNDGTIQKDSNRISDNFEVTIGVPGDQAVWGKDDKGRIEDSGGETSMSVPFVTATAALVRSLDPSLDASAIKSLLVKTARKSIDVGGNQVPAPKEVGGSIVAIDLAVQETIANLRNSTKDAS
jgi:hypothetical protein